MKTRRILTSFISLALLISLLNCGPVIISSRPNTPPPGWFYPNRVETVRYVYFPDHYIYYDLTLRTYIYLDNGVWISAAILPARYHTINLRRSRQVRVTNFFGNDIARYHKENHQKPQGRSGSRSRRN